MTQNPTISQILDKYAEYYYDKKEGFGSNHTLSKEEAEAQLIAYIEGIIGKDEFPKDETLAYRTKMYTTEVPFNIQNRLRAEQRARLHNKGTEPDNTKGKKGV